MAPTARGFWDPTTATIDWCEKNYEVSVYSDETKRKSFHWTDTPTTTTRLTTERHVNDLIAK